VEDLRIPAYIRRQLSIHDSRDAGTRKNSAPDDSHNPLSSGGSSEREDKIEKGLSDTPAYLRRKNNGV
jgi:cell division protein FtsZ